MGVSIPPDHPDYQDTYRVPVLIAVGTPSAFASANSSVQIPAARGGLLVVAGTGAGGSISLISQPSGTVLGNEGANVAPVTGVIPPQEIPPTDTQLNFVVVNGVLEVWTVDNLVFALGLTVDAGLEVRQAGAGFSRSDGAWLQVLVDPNQSGSYWQGQKTMADSLPVTLASDQPALPERAKSWDQSGFNAPAAGNQLAVSIPAPGLGLHNQLDRVTLTLGQSAAPAAWSGALQVRDGGAAGTIIWEEAIAQPATAQALLTVDRPDLRLRQATANAVLWVGTVGVGASSAGALDVGTYSVA